MSDPNPAKIELLKVWYSVFSVVMEMWRNHEYTDPQALEKLTQLQAEMDTRVAGGMKLENLKVMAPQEGQIEN